MIVTRILMYQFINLINCKRFGELEARRLLFVVVESSLIEKSCKIKGNKIIPRILIVNNVKLFLIDKNIEIVKVMMA